MGSDYREAVLSFIQLRGPTLPVHVAKHMNTNTLMASAMLSELSSKKSLKISALKVGGSPLYYVPGHEEKLLQFIQNLNEKDRRTLELLKDSQVLRDAEQDPLTRVSLRQIKDFAVPLDVTAGDSKEIFWKWFQLTDDQAIPLIKKLMGIQEKQQTLEFPAAIQEPNHLVPKVPEKQKMPDKPKAEPKQKKRQADDFSIVLAEYFKTRNIAANGQTVLKKGEIECIAEVPTPIGPVSFYCRAKQKEKITDADISSAVVQGQLRKLPVLFITAGQLNKKAENLLSSITGITVVELSGSKNS